jgi:outer membrane protein assembly factor BamA
MGGLNDRSRPISRFTSDLEVYAPLSDNKRFVTVLRGGGGHIFSEDFEYFQAVTLGANNALRGFRKSRFAGSSALYGSAELRARLFKFKSRLVPGDLGILGFGDSGRVWLDGEESNKWHKDLGGGIYYTPFNVALVSLLASFSEEDGLVNLSVGAGVNFTF